jgi:hypothetical protein
VADVGDRLTCDLLGLARAGGRHHELGAAVGRVGLAGDVAEPLELVDGVHDGRLGEPRARGQLGGACPVCADVLGDGQQRRAEVSRRRRFTPALSNR